MSPQDGGGSPPDGAAEDPLLGELRNLFSQADPVPPLVSETAKASLGWRRLDADLADLLADSLDVDAYVGVRGQAPLRAVTFTAGALSIDIEIHGEGPQRRLRGQLSPPAETTIELQRLEPGEPTVIRSDHLGRFQTPLAAGGSLRLRIASGDGDRPDWIETSWISV